MKEEPYLIAGRYRVLEKIAQGGMGKVYHALQEDLGREVAVKILSPVLAEDPSFRERFRQEALVIADLSHPHVINVIGIEKYRDSFCIVMEYLKGRSLQELVDEEGALQSRRVAKIGAAVADALHYAHQKEIVHRDVKPDNVMILEDGGIKVMDFGIAQWSSSSVRTETGMRLGTPLFMSPEQIRGKGVDARSDIYSLGLTLYYAATGRPAWDASNAVDMALLQEKPPPPPSLYIPGIPEELERIILKCIKLRPRERYQSAREVASDLKNFISDFFGKPSTEVIPEKTPPSRKEATQIQKPDKYRIPKEEPAPKSAEPEEVEEEQEIPVVKQEAGIKGLRILVLAGAVFVLIAVLAVTYAPDKKTGGTPSLTEPAPVETPHETPSETAVQKEPPEIKTADEHYRKALLLLAEKDSNPEEVRGHFQAALDLQPDYYEVVRDYGYFLFEQKDNRKAEAFLKKALELRPDSSDTDEIQRRIAVIHSRMNH